MPYYLLAYKLGFDTPVDDIEAYLADQKAHTPAVSNETAASGPSEESLLALLDKSEVMVGAKTTFSQYCAACHGLDGQGLIGPNLTDNAWIHGGSLLEIKKSVAKGIPEKGMVAWEATLKPDQINSLVAYIRSLKGSNPPNPKAQEGTVVN